MTLISDAVRALDGGTAARIQSAAWRQVTTQIDGLAMGGGLATLARTGALEAVAATPGIGAGQIASRFGLRLGYLHIVLKLMAGQGWLLREGPIGPQTRLHLTETALPAFAPLYRYAEMALDASCRWLRGDADAAAALLPITDAAMKGWSESDSPVLPTIREHLNGHLAAPILAQLHAAGVLPSHADLDRPLDLDCFEPTLARRIAALLFRLGWTDSPFVPNWTIHGLAAALMLPQYWYPLSYLPTLARVGDILAGRTSMRGDPGRYEADKVDRRLDIRFSGEVFSTVCSRRFRDMAVPYAVQARPRHLVDIGCGDGSLLLETWRALAQELGAANAPVPVAVDLSDIALSVCTNALRSEGIPVIAIKGDATQPGDIARRLRDHGIDGDDCLFVCKSVIHDRDYVAPRGPVPVGDSLSDLVFLDDDGALIAAPLIEASLSELFAAWRPLIARHGWLVIEAHTTSAAVAARHRGRTQAAILDATHGYSHQYLLDAASFARAAERAGLSSAGHAEIGAVQMGHAALTIDHFRVRT